MFMQYIDSLVLSVKKKELTEAEAMRRYREYKSGGTPLHPALSDIERLRAGIGTDPRNMDEPFDPGSLRLNCDPMGRLDMDGMKRLRSVLDVKTNYVHRAVSISKRLGN